MSIVLVTTDLMASSKVAPVASGLGVPFRAVGSPAAISEITPPPKLIVLDLNSPLGDVSQVVATLKCLSPPPQVIAFGPHVHEAKLQAAVNAGCDAVFVRGQFHAQAAEIFRRFLG